MRLIGIIALMLFITDSAWSFDFDRGAGVDIKAVIAESNIELPSVSAKNDWM